MKKLLILSTILLLSIITMSQELLITINPPKLGPGLMYDHTIINSKNDTANIKISILGGVEGGVWKYGQEELGILKYSFGTSFKLMNLESPVSLITLIDYQHIYKDDSDIFINKDKLNKISFEIGFSARIKKDSENSPLFVLLWDPLNIEARIGVGIKLKKLNKY